MSGSASVGFVGAALCVVLARGPWEEGWLGWSEGWGIRRRDLGGGKVGGETAQEPAIEQVLDEVVAEQVLDTEEKTDASGSEQWPQRDSEKSSEDTSTVEGGTELSDLRTKS